jgi:hypothetical protein
VLGWQTAHLVTVGQRSVRGLVRRDGVPQARWRYGVYGAVVDSGGSAPVGKEKLLAA